MLLTAAQRCEPPPTNVKVARTATADAPRPPGGSRIYAAISNPRKHCGTHEQVGDHPPQSLITALVEGWRKLLWC